MKKINTYSDESGQAASGKDFIVSTVIIDTKNVGNLESLLITIEKESNKIRKWTDSSMKKRANYAKLLLRRKIFSTVTVYYTIYRNKEDYVPLISTHLAKSILDHTKGEKYVAKIFLDKVNNKIHKMIRGEIKSHKIRYRKIRSLDDTNNVYLKLADAICGLARDINNRGIDESYSIIFKKLKKI